jgi:nitrite reductase/ring-hydroxylating ferredoxin subunit/uncharacterized membrane protein
VLTDITIGAWVLGSVFDAWGAATDNDEVRKMADRLTEVGTISAVPTALTGLTDFSTFPDWSAAPATIHGAMNIVNIGLYALSIRERRRGNRRRGVALSSIAIGLSCFSAWLGGALVYKHKLGVDHSDTFSGPKRWKPVMDASALHQRQPRTVDVEDGKKVLIYRVGDQVHAIGNKCSHAGGPLNEGKFKGDCVQCPWHDSVFDVRDGSIVHGPATMPQPRFEARIREGQVEIRLMETRVKGRTD